jgi:putative ABC transport system permease protein
VERAAASTRLPFVFDQNATNYFIAGEPTRPDQTAQVVDRTFVTPAYFETLSATLVHGRAITEADRGDVRVGVVNEALARRHWPDGRWEGGRIAFDVIPADDRGWIQIVGVIGDIRAANLSTPAEPMIYLPLAQQPQSSLFVLVRTAGDPTASAAPVRAVLRRIDPEVPLYNLQIMGTRKAESVRKPRFMAMLLGGLGLLALAIATIGVYGVMAFDTSRRTREIGIRIALGARPASVASQVTARGLALTAAGITLGLAAAFAATPALAGQLYGVSRTDVASFSVAAAALLATAMLAAWLPARRASRVDPAVALRGD